MGKNEMGSPMNASVENIKNKSDVEFGTGNVDDTRLEVKKSLPEAKRFTESSKDRRNNLPLMKR